MPPSQFFNFSAYQPWSHVLFSRGISTALPRLLHSTPRHAPCLPLSPSPLVVRRRTALPRLLVVSIFPHSPSCTAGFHTKPYRSRCFPDLFRLFTRIYQEEREHLHPSAHACSVLTTYLITNSTPTFLRIPSPSLRVTVVDISSPPPSVLPHLLHDGASLSAGLGICSRSRSSSASSPPLSGQPARPDVRSSHLGLSPHGLLPAHRDGTRHLSIPPTLTLALPSFHSPKLQGR